jgi:hypothetical protein
LGDHPDPGAGHEDPPPPYAIQRTDSRQADRASRHCRLPIVGFRRVKREERSQPPGLRPDGPHYSATASRGAGSSTSRTLHLVEIVLQSHLIAPWPPIALTQTAALSG